MKFGRAARLGEHRGVELHADERPGARGDVCRAGGVHRHGSDGRGRVVRADRDEVCAAQPQVDRQVVAQRAEHTAGLDDGRDQRGDVGPGRRGQRREGRPTPPPRRGVQQAGGRGVGQLGDLHPAEPVAQQVGHEQQPSCRGEPHRPGRGAELEDRVERLHLHAGQGVVLGRGHPREDPLGHAVGPVVAVVHRVAQQRAVGVEQAVVHRPGVDAHRPDRPVLVPGHP